MREVFCYLLQLYWFIILVRVVLSWFPSQPDSVLEKVHGAVGAVTEPLLGPLRSVLPPVRMGSVALDLSPIVLLFAIVLLQGAVCA